MILRIVESETCGPRTLRLAFNDGTRKTVDLGPLLYGPVFEPLRNPEFFALAALDPIFIAFPDLFEVKWSMEARP